MHHELKQQAIQLRKEKELSYNAIRAELGVAKSTLHEWLENFPLSRERILELKRAGWKKADAKIELYRLAMKEKREASQKEIYEKYKEKFKKFSTDSFFIAGLMLYLAEGSKTNNARICIVNTDPRIIKFFIKWLHQFLKISKESLRAELHLYETMDIPKEYQFWKGELGFSDQQFYKTQIRKLQKSSFSYQESFRHGTCSLIADGVKKKAEVMMAIKAFMDTA